MFDSLFSERGLSLERLRALIEVHDAGSIARTAPGNAIRHSQYSRQLRELSEFFGCEVTRRRGKVLKLTAEGERLAEFVRPLLRGLEDFHLECKNENTVFTIAAGDSLIHWLVIPRLGKLLQTLPEVRFATTSLRTNEIVQQISDGRIDFGLIRKNAMAPGLKSAALGTLSYVAIVPTALTIKKKVPSFSEVFSKFPLAMQTTDGQFSKELREIAIAQNETFRPGLGCQSFPQTLAAVRSGHFAAVTRAGQLYLLFAGKHSAVLANDPFYIGVEDVRIPAVAWRRFSLRVQQSKELRARNKKLPAQSPARL